MRYKLLIAALSLIGITYAATTNMGLVLPTVGVTTGPDWATLINNAFETVDAHDHGPGKGVQISNAGISSSAAIARSKLATGGASYVLINDTSGAMSEEQILTAQHGGTGMGSYTPGALLYACSATGLCPIAPGSANQLLKMVGGAPIWATVSPGAAPTVQKFTSGSGATYTRPTSPTPSYIVVELVGGGGGGGAQNTNNGGSGTASTFSCQTLSAGGGTGGSTGGSAGGAGGTASLGTGTGVAINGAAGGSSMTNPGTNVAAPGGAGGNSVFGGAGAGGASGGASGSAATNSGSGGGGASGANSVPSAAGGGAGAYVRSINTSPPATCTYTVGSAGSGGTAGGLAGGNGAAGIIIVTEFY